MNGSQVLDRLARVQTVMDCHFARYCQLNILAIR